MTGGGGTRPTMELKFSRCKLMQMLLVEGRVKEERNGKGMYELWSMAKYS